LFGLIICLRLLIESVACMRDDLALFSRIESWRQEFPEHPGQRRNLKGFRGLLLADKASSKPPFRSIAQTRMPSAFSLERVVQDRWFLPQQPAHQSARINRWFRCRVICTEVPSWHRPSVLLLRNPKDVTHRFSRTNLCLHESMQVNAMHRVS